MFGISNDTWALILFGSVLGFFLSRLIRQIDKLSENVASLNITIVRVETDTSNKNSAFQAILGEHHERVELIAKRVHWIINKITELKLRLEAQGMSFDKESWRSPD